MHERLRLWFIGLLCGACLGSQSFGNLTAAELIQLNEKNFDALCPKGKEVDAIYGDWVLRNENIVAVIAAPKAGRDANMSVRDVGAMLIDFTPRSPQSDQLSCFYPAGARYAFRDAESAKVVVDGRELGLSSQTRFEGRALSVTFLGEPDSGSASSATVTYALGDRDIALSYQVQLVNETDRERDLLAQDLLRCDGSTFKFGNDEASRLFWAEERFYHQAYGILPDEGTLKMTKERRSTTLATIAEDKSVVGEAVAAGKSTTWGGKLLCSQGLPGIRRMVEALSNAQPTQLYQLKLHASDGEVTQAEVEFLLDGETLGIVNTDREGWARVRLTPGTYALKISAPAREAREHKFELGASPLAETLTLNPATRVKCRVTDQAGQAIAAKLQFMGQDDTESPDFGPDTNDFGVRNVLYTADGTVSQPLAPGRYVVIISHGPEYDAVTEPLTVRAGQVAQLEAQLKRSVDTSGWVSGEFHSHSSPSGDNTTSQLGRVLNLLCEHIEFAPCTEHNRIDTYEDHLKLLKATARMATCSGMELTGQPLPVNHQNAFPLHRHPHHQNGGGPTPDVDPVVQIQRLAMWEEGSDKVVQMNHPNIPQILGDRDLDNTPDEGFRKMFDFMDVVEVHPLQTIFTPPTAKVAPRDRGSHRVFHWMQLLNLGYHVPGVVNTDAHYNWHGSGWLRNYIHSSTDDPAKVSTEEMMRVIQAGHMVMTTAPFMEVELRARVGGQARTFLVGDHVALGKEPSKLWVRVQCANWYDVNRVQVFANGRPLPELNFTRGSHAGLFKTDTIRFESEIELPQFTEDTHIIVATIGEDLKLGPVMGSLRGEMEPVAVSNPIYLDVDGGKFKPNRDNLGVPFMLPEGSEDAPAKASSNTSDKNTSNK